MSLVVLVEQGIWVNLATMVFNNLYSKLWDLFASTKPRMNRDNTKFNIVQVVDILLRNWFLVNLTFIMLDYEEEDEGATRFPLEIQIAKGTRVLGACFWRTQTNLDEEMDDVEELGGMNSQPKTSQQ
jgi:hypothetical protein